MDYILVINPGSTSTKIALFDGDKERFSKTIEHSMQEINSYDTIASQYDFRKKAIESFLLEENIDIKSLKIIMGRGGAGLKPVSAGGYAVNDKMILRLKENPIIQHASNLGALIAKELADAAGAKAYIYDPIVTDELMDIARISGLKKVPRISAWHALNSRAMAMMCASEKGKELRDLNIIACHIGGGISCCALKKGKAVDIVGDDEGSFSPQRSGGIPSFKLVELCFENGYDYKTISKKIRGNGGIVDYLNTTDIVKIMHDIENGDEYAKLIIDAMVLQISKSIASLSASLCGKVDFIILTGGVANCDYITEYIKNRISFISEVIIKPGENEMLALAFAGHRLLKGQEKAKDYLD